MSGAAGHASLRWLALLGCAVPLLATHASLLISIDAVHFPACNPYTLDCVSISKAARNPPASFFFKAIMLPYCGLIIALWWRLSASLTLRTGSTTGTGAFRFWGCAAAVFLAVYVVALGVEGDRYQLLRKIGVVLSFTLTYMAQLLCTRWCWQRRTLLQLPARLFALQWALLVGMLVLGVVSVLLDALWAEYDRSENAFEWWLALMLYGYFASVALLASALMRRAGPD